MSTREFALRRGRWSWFFIRPLAWGRIGVTVDDTDVTVRVGALGGGTIPLAKIERIGTMNWPWWGGIGVRVGKGLVAFVAGSGECALLELSEPVPLRAPLRWKAARVVIAVDDLDGFTAAVAAARRETMIVK